ncbi:MAG: DUF4340 domain-containing protein [Elusimicrobia bacterium]|nr:DUF4340 domain-containing protein [Elusimicrobiota bacterium]
MTPRQVLLLASAAAVLAGAAALLLRLQGPAEPSRPLAGLQAADVARIEVDFRGGRLALERAAGTWRLTAPLRDEADTGAAEDLSQSLRGLALGSQVSRDPAGWADYELDESSAVRVRVYSRASAAPVLDGWFGKPALGDSVYFRSSREPAVYLAEGVQSHALRRGADELRSKALLSIPLGELERLRFAGPAGFTLKKSGGSWLAEGRRLSADQAAELVLAASSLRFLELAPADAPAGKAGFDRPALDLSAAGGGRGERILLGREDSGRRHAKSESRAAAGFVSKADADNLLKLLP